MRAREPHHPPLTGSVFLLSLLVTSLSPAAHAASDVDLQKLAAANTGFNFRLLKQIARGEPGRNIFISPYSAATALQMVCNGAAGRTKQEMQRVLGTSGFAPEVLNAANRDCQQAITDQGTNIILEAANAIWHRKGLAVKPGFLSVNQQFFGATVQGVDFRDPQSVNIIDRWASEKTHGKIPSIADGMLSPATELFLANAVYFKGSWVEPFDAKLTKERTFHSRGGGQRNVLMMEQAGKFIYRRGTEYQAVRLPYQGWRLGMYVFLPDANSSLEKLLERLNGETWPKVTEPGFNHREGRLVLPKFRIEYRVEMEQPLKALGMVAAFGTADFSGISDSPLFISAVRQKTFVDVDEKGTEAAAVTIAEYSSSIELNPPKPFEMIVDRPFLFLIHDSRTGMILFAGRVVEM